MQVRRNAADSDLPNRSPCGTNRRYERYARSILGAMLGATVILFMRQAESGTKLSKALAELFQRFDAHEGARN
jgi:hypothetical protein